MRGEIAELRESKGMLLSKLRDAERSRSLDSEEALKPWGTAFGGDPIAPNSEWAGALQPSGKRLHPKGRVLAASPRASIPTMDRTLAAVSAMVLGIAFGLAGGALFRTGPNTDSGQVAAAGSEKKVVSVSGSPSADAPGQTERENPSTTAPAGRPIESAGAVKGKPIAASAAKTMAANGGPVEPDRGSAGEPTPGMATPGDSPKGHSNGPSAVGDSEPSKPAWELPIYLADLAPDAFKVRLGAQAAPCAFADSLMDPARRDGLLGALGPCIGAHGKDGIPVGTHRVAGVDCCAHHAFVERMTQASRDADAMAGILAEAHVAQQDGQVPPLLRLRAERSALQFMRRLAGTWASAGIDDGSMGHRWTASNSDPTRMRMSSWIRLEESGKSYSFEMEIELKDGPRGDLLVAFDWLGKDPLGVVIQKRADAVKGK